MEMARAKCDRVTARSGRSADRADGSLRPERQMLVLAAGRAVVRTAPKGCAEGTRTMPNYLVNRAEQKNLGSIRGNAHKFRNRCTLIDRSGLWVRRDS